MTPVGAMPHTWKEALYTEGIFNKMGYDVKKYLDDYSIDNPPDPLEFINSSFIAYYGHAWTDGGGYNFNTYSLESDKIWLNSPLVFMEGCGSCAFEFAQPKSKLFCANLLRRGVMFQFAATVDASGSNLYVPDLIGELFDSNLGDAVKSLRNRVAMRELNRYEPYSVLVGDPLY